MLELTYQTSWENNGKSLAYRGNFTTTYQMKHCTEQLACLTATILIATNVAEAADKGTDAQRKDTVAKVEACMQAGFTAYKYTKKEGGEEFKIGA
jgi:hypothetical protein